MLLLSKTRNTLLPSKKAARKVLAIVREERVILPYNEFVY